MNRAHLILCIRSELRKQNMTFHKLPGSSDNFIFLVFVMLLLIITLIHKKNLEAIAL